ncbi:MAG: 4Fe-4S binding protein, partial [Sphaerochaeta sp.]|nr:4Fe-4S binding protein [Sphaerochaeta sp.]
AIEVLISEGRNTDPNFERYTRDAVALPAGLSTQPAAAKTEDQSAAITFTGKTTLGDLLIAGYQQEDIEAILGPMKKTDAIKAIAEGQGLSFSEVKAKILEL